LVLCRTDGFHGKGFGFAEGDGGDAGGDVSFDGGGVAGFAAEAGDFACCGILC